MANPEPLRRLIRDTQLTDREIRKVMRDAAAEADRIIRSLEGKQGIGSKVRSAQAQVAKLQVEMWDDVERNIRSGAGRSFISAADLQVLADKSLIAAAGVPREVWKRSMIAQAEQGIDAYLARRQNGYTLSKRVYRNTAMSRDYVERAINNGLLLGKGPYEIARNVKRFINPDVPGGASYAAMRLGRTEVANAFHTRTVNGYRESPWTHSVKWNLSGSHPTADVCNDYAEDTHYRGGSAGEFKSDEVPSKPHPQCLCYVTPVQVDLDTFVSEFKSGQYNDYIDGIISKGERRRAS